MSENNYWRATIKISYEDKKGNLGYRNENYIVYAVSPTDVEKKLAEHLGVSDYEVTSIGLISIVDVLK